jgi:hypothetical protein
MSELVYNNGHNHPVEVSSPSNRRSHRPNSVWRITHDLWDEVLYGVGSLCDKIQGR